MRDFIRYPRTDRELDTVSQARKRRAPSAAKIRRAAHAVVRAFAAPVKRALALGGGR